MKLPTRVAAKLARRAIRRAGARTVTVLLIGSARLGIGERMSRLILSEAGRRIRENRRASAGQMLSPLTSRPPRSIPTGMRAGQLLAKAGMPAQAKQIYDTLLAEAGLSNAERSQLLALSAAIEKRAGRYPAAAAQLAAAVATAPASAKWAGTRSRWNHQLGLIEEKAGRWDNAVAAHRLATTHAAAPASWWRHLGRALERAGQLSDAVIAYEEAIARGDRDSRMIARLTRLKRVAPEHIFLPRSAGAGHQLDSYPQAAEMGIVAPIMDGFIAGWLPAEAAVDRDAYVQIKLNGTVVTDALATTVVTLPDRRQYRRFVRKLPDLWSYAGEGDVLEVERNGRPLPIAGSGLRHVLTSGQSRSGELLDLLSRGYVLNKYGKLQQSLLGDHDWQRAIFELYSTLRDDLREEFKVDLIPFYGTLLGAVREQDFIKSDNDFDTVYISAHRTADAARDEFISVCRYLIGRGYALVVKPTHTRVMPVGDTRKLDIFFGWFDESDRLQVSFGYHSKPIAKSDEFFADRSERLGTLKIPVPGNAETVLEQLYGSGWRVPDPGFKHYSTTRIMPSGHQLDTDQVTELYWHQFYRDNKIEGGSEFAKFVTPRLRPNSTVFEFGCGTGRDSIYLAQHGHYVIAADRAPEAIEQARRASGDVGLGNLRFEVLDVSQRADLESFLRRAGETSDGSGNAVVYMRFLLHSIAEPVEETLLDTLASQLSSGFTLYAEFRTVQDKALDKVYGNHFRRYLDERALADKLTRMWGFDIEYLEAGQGFSPYQGEDPFLARLIARLPHDRGRR